jgi:hypothetical protein
MTVTNKVLFMLQLVCGVVECRASVIAANKALSITTAGKRSYQMQTSVSSTNKILFTDAESKLLSSTQQV